MVTSAISLDSIAKQYGPMISSICRRMIRNEDTAKDAAQEVWLEIQKSIHSFRGESKLSTWIYTLAYHVILRHAKLEKVYSTRFLAGFFHGPEQEYRSTDDPDKNYWIRSMCDKCLTGILHCLDNQSRLAYIYRDMAELDYSEIAQILELDESNVRKIVSRSRSKLNKFLNNECALHNPNGSCSCRMKRYVTEIKLPDEYQKLYRSIRHVSTFRASEKVLPVQDYWAHWTCTVHPDRS